MYIVGARLIVNVPWTLMLAMCYEYTILFSGWTHPTVDCFFIVKSCDSTTAPPTLQMVKVDLSYAHYILVFINSFRDVDKAESSFAVTFIIVQS